MIKKFLHYVGIDTVTYESKLRPFQTLEPYFYKYMAHLMSLAGLIICLIWQLTAILN